MRLALISDVHGNAVALESVLADIAETDVDVVVCLGDIAANGPQPALAVEIIEQLACPVVMGNTDESVLDVPEWWRHPASVGAPESAQRVVELSAWCADQLTDDHLRYLASLPGTLDIDLQGAGRMLAFHGSPRSSTEVITDSTSDSDLSEMIAGSARYRVLAGGHTHVPSVRWFGDQLIVNPGSVGLPFAEYGFAGEVQVMNHAAYGILQTSNASDIDVEIREIPVDQSRLVSVVQASGMPHANWWLSQREAQTSR